MTFKVEAGKRYVRRDGSVMGKPLETSTHADLRSKYQFFDPGIPTHIKTNGFALAGSDGQFDLVSLYEEHKMPELDLTKPLRIRADDYYQGYRFYYSGLNDTDRNLAGFIQDKDGDAIAKLMMASELENIPPEPVKEEPKMPELDPTKPMRIRREVNYNPYKGERFYYSGVNSPNGFLAGFVLDKNGSPWGKFMKPEELENIPPEPVKQSFYLWFNEADKGASLYAHSNYSPHFKPSMAKILIWAEDGKTKVEVCDD